MQVVTQHYNFRFTAPVYGSACLLAGIGVDAVLPTFHRVLAPLGRVTVWIILGFAISMAALRDLNFARERLIGPEIPDLALRPVLGLPPAPLQPVTANTADAQPSAPSMASLEAAARNNPTVDNRINLSLAYINGNAPGMAIPVLQAVLATEPDNLIAWNNLCVAHIMQKDYTPALKECERAVQIDPTYQLAKNNLKWAQEESAKAK